MNFRRGDWFRAFAAIAIVAAFGMPSVVQSVAAQPLPQRPIYKDPSQTVDRRVEDLLSRMSLDEKVAQLLTIWEQKSKVETPDGRFSAERASAAFPNGIGGFARPSDRRGAASNGAAGAAA